MISKKINLGLLILIVSLILFNIVCIPGARADDSLIGLAKKIRPGVVLIETFDKNKTPMQQASGFLISTEGHLLTNYHVIEGAYSAIVTTISGEQFPIKGIIAQDVDADAVKLLADIGDMKISVLELADVLPSVGEDIAVVGNPFGLESTLSNGIVSAIREIPEIGHILQITAPVSKGSSGSPVLNMKGQVIGIATFIISEGQALNFAIPSKKLLNLSSGSEIIKLSENSPQQNILPPTNSATANPCLKFLPSDWWLVGNFNCKVFMDFAFEVYKDDPVQFGMMNQYLEMAKGITGIDFQREVQYVVFILSGNPDLNPQFLCIVKGTFDNDVTELRLSLGLGAGMKRSLYKDTVLYEDIEMCYGFPEESTLMLGSKTLLRSSIDVLSQKTKLMPDSLHRLLERTNGESILWMATRPKVVLNMDGIKEECQKYPVFYKKISEIQYTSFFFERAYDGYLASALAYLPEQGESEKLYRYLKENKEKFLNIDGANVFLSSFLLTSDVILDGAYVRWNSHLTVEALNKLWNTKLLLKSSK